MNTISEYVNLIAGSVRQDRSKSIAPNIPESTPERIRRAAMELAQAGITTIPDFLPQEECDNLRAKIENQISNLTETTTIADDVTVSFRGGSKPARRYRNAVNVDLGMIDMFDADRAVSELTAIKEDTMIRDILTLATGRELIPSRLNIYINRSVTSTRGYHMDSGALQFKAFVYLTDVNDLEDGPYSFIKRSHRFSTRKYLNITQNLMSGYHLTEMSNGNPADVVHALAPRGTLIISDQNGWHRGLPQTDGRSRMLISISFLPR